MSPDLVLGARREYLYMGLQIWGRNSPEKYLVDLGRDTRTSTQSRRIVRRKDASWSLNWPSGANLQARKQHMYFFWCLCDYFVLVFLCYWESINQTRLEKVHGCIFQQKECSFRLIIEPSRQRGQRAEEQITQIHTQIKSTKIKSSRRTTNEQKARYLHYNLSPLGDVVSVGGLYKI